MPLDAAQPEPFALPDQGRVTRRSETPPLALAAWLLAFVMSEVEILGAVVDGRPVDEGGVPAVVGRSLGRPRMPAS
jgi:hypothetical protein